jgi:hypothetical protein
MFDQGVSPEEPPPHVDEGLLVPMGGAQVA